jgi:hypothetical protein
MDIFRQGLITGELLMNKETAQHFWIVFDISVSMVTRYT